MIVLPCSDMTSKGKKKSSIAQGPKSLPVQSKFLAIGIFTISPSKPTEEPTVVNRLNCIATNHVMNKQFTIA